MVGVRRTNSCETCRRRRVKCDEVRPVCGQCAKKNRECTESPLPDFIWIKAGNRNSLLSTQSGSGEEEKEPVASANEKNQPLSLLTAKPTTNGAVFYKYRIGNGSGGPKTNQPREKKAAEDLILHRPPRLTATERLRLEFIAAYYDSPTGYCLANSSNHLHHIPRHLGRSVALDDAVTCLIRTHGSLIRGIEGDSLHEESYFKALNSLQVALEDKRWCRHSTTLATILMLLMTEGIGRSGANWNYVKHSGGMTAFVKLAGRECMADELGKSIMSTAIGPMIVEAFISRKSCLLSEAEWLWLYYKENDAGAKRQVEVRQIFQLSTLATLVADIRAARERLLSTGEMEDLLETWDRLANLSKAMHQSKADLHEALKKEHLDEQPVWYHAPEDETSPFLYECEFVDRPAANTVVLNWGMVIHVNEVVRDLYERLDQLQAAPQGSREMAKAAEEESRRLAEHVCGSLAYAKRYAPLGSQFVAYSVCLSWRYVPESAREWMLEELNRMNGSQMNCYKTSWLNVISQIMVH